MKKDIWICNMQCKFSIFVRIIEYNNVCSIILYVIILSLITFDQSHAIIFHMFQYHYLGPDDWVDAARK